MILILINTLWRGHYVPKLNQSWCSDIVAWNGGQFHNVPGPESAQWHCPESGQCHNVPELDRNWPRHGHIQGHFLCTLTCLQGTEESKSRKLQSSKKNHPFGAANGTKQIWWIDIHISFDDIRFYLKIASPFYMWGPELAQRCACKCPSTKCTDHQVE